MTQQIIDVGASANDGEGNPLRTAFTKCNNNFGELYSRVQTEPPATLEGSVGDTAGMYAYDANYFYYCFQDYDGSSIIWGQISEAGNVAVSAITNGTSNVQIPTTNGNVRFNIAGSSNVLVVSSTGLSATANITGANINGTNIYGTLITASQTNITQVGTLSSLTVTANTTSGNLLTGGIVSATGNVTGGNLVTGGLITATGNVTGGNVSAVANVQAGNVNAATVSASGNITTSGYFVGTFVGNVTGNFVVPGNNTEVLFNTSGNADAVSNFTFNKATNVMAVVGNVSSGNVLVSGISSTTGNVTGGNLNTGGQVVATGNVTGGNILTVGQVSATANVTGGNIVSSSRISAAGNIDGGNLRTTGQVSASGNITGGNVVGGQLSAVSNISGGNISVSGNITGGNIITGGDVSATANVVVTANITGGNLLTGGIISATGNITGNYIFGNGSQLTGIDATSIQSGTSNARIVSSNGNLAVSIGGTSNVAVFSSNGEFITGVMSVSGNITGGNIAFNSGQVTGTGNITGGNLLTSGLISATGNVTGGNLLTSGLISATGNVTGGNLITAGLVSLSSITKTGSNAVGNIGSSSNYFNTVFAQATSALYADLAENYTSDDNYESGTVLCFDGTAEVTQCNTDSCATVAGVVSTNPAYVMNSGLTGEHVVSVALVGRVPCRVQGSVPRGAMMVSAGNGLARAEKNPAIGTVIGKALESFDGDQGTIEIVVGRL